MTVRSIVHGWKKKIPILPFQREVIWTALVNVALFAKRGQGRFSLLPVHWLPAAEH
jgi:hypothetical protein